MTADEFEEGPATFGIVNCRGCGKLSACHVEAYDGEWLPMSSSWPLFGECPSTKEFPFCTERIAAAPVFAVEEPGDYRDTSRTWNDVLKEGGPGALRAAIDASIIDASLRRKP